jgi:hypothetical protein
MTEMDAYDVVLSVVAEADQVVPGELEATAEVILSAVQREAAFVALGPVVSVNFEESSIEVGCTICGDDAEELHGKVARVFRVMLEAANGFEYQGSTTHRLEPVLA